MKIIVVRRTHNLANGMRRNNLDESGRQSVAIGIFLSSVRVFFRNYIFTQLTKCTQIATQSRS
jgi:hypothetical protein